MNYRSIGGWSEAKLEIIRKYSKAYSTILAKHNLRHAYIDAFSGAGMHVSRKTTELVEGSPLQALSAEPPFEHYYFIDTNADYVRALRDAVGSRSDVDIYNDDCNTVLPTHVYPRVTYEGRWRALCLLDPYGLHLDWNVIREAGRARSIEIFLNFPISDMNRNALLTDPSKAKPSHVERMNRFWGDASWREIVYSTEAPNLEVKRKAAYSSLVAAFRQRLMEVAGFSYVPEPVIMRMYGQKGPIFYYFFFASHNEKGAKIATDIFRKYRESDGLTLF